MTRVLGLIALLFALPASSFTAAILADPIRHHVLIASRSAPQSPKRSDFTVAADGSGDFTTVQQAVDRIPENNSQRFVIYIKAGTYKEQVRVPTNKPYVTFLGEQPEKTRLTFGLGNSQVGSTSASYSTYIGASDFHAANLTFENSFGVGSQAVAILVDADRAIFRNCRFLGWQDTLYAKNGRQYYKDCYIEGHVDFIFGAATAVFENCQIHSKGAGYITAQMRFSESEPSGFVFRRGRLTGSNTGKGVFLGRPWRPFGRVVFLQTEMQAHILPAGWDNWRDPEREKTAWFAEYRSQGKGANPTARVNWSRQLAAEEAKQFFPENFLKGPDGWRPDSADFLWQTKNPPAFRAVTWDESLKQSAEWYATDEATRIADNVILYQRNNGGWEKNIDMATVLTEREKADIAKSKSNTDTTIDNGATYTQLAFLAKVFTAKNLERHKIAFLSGLDFLLAAQYENGGFPQYFPVRKGYYSHITFNDGAMIGVLKLFRDIARQKSASAFVDEARRRKVEQAVQKGIECILKTQVVVNSQRTVWCAQHDEITLAPAPARKFELISLSGGESVGIVRFLMGIDQPDPQVVAAIEAAIAWFEKSKLKGIKWVRLPDKSTPGGFDRVVIKDPEAGPIWARFYEIGTNKPIFAGRDGETKYSVAEIEAERRNGYEWYVTSPAALLDKDYPEWHRLQSVIPLIKSTPHHRLKSVPLLKRL
ncbi:MAG: pectate lyase [Pyrinomonadaceae bacterium]